MQLKAREGREEKGKGKGREIFSGREERADVGSPEDRCQRVNGSESRIIRLSTLQATAYNGRRSLLHRTASPVGPNSIALPDRQVSAVHWIRW